VKGVVEGILKGEYKRTLYVVIKLILEMDDVVVLNRLILNVTTTFLETYLLRQSSKTFHSFITSSKTVKSSKSS